VGHAAAFEPAPAAGRGPGARPQKRVGTHPARIVRLSFVKLMGESQPDASGLARGAWAGARPSRCRGDLLLTVSPVAKHPSRII
jgi:hypothetical protein